MSQLTQEGEVKAAKFDRPLLLTPTQDLAGYASRYAGQALLLLITSVSVLAVLLIFVYITREALPFFTGLGVGEFFSSTDWRPTASPPHYGILTLVTGSLYVTLGAMLVAVPVALGVAVFLSDIAPFRLRQVVKPLLEILAAIPSVAYGFFAVMVVAPWMQEHMGLASGANALNAAIILAVMAVPSIASVSEDALAAIGRDLREGSYALGATRAETIVKVVIPAARSGILAAVILGMMRVIGETMVVWMASGNASQIPSPWWDLSQSIRTITATVAQDMGESEGNHRRALFALATSLLAITFAMNLLSEHFLAMAKKPKIRRMRAEGYSHRSRLWSMLEELSFQWAKVLLPIRRMLDKAFTVCCGGAVVAMLIALVTILGPMIWKGASAVIFRDTVEFRNLQYQSYGRGSSEALAAQLAQCRANRQGIYDILDRFGRGINPEPLAEEVKTIHRQFKKQIENRPVSQARQEELAAVSEGIRDDLRKAVEASDKIEATALLQKVLKLSGDARLKDTVAERYFTIARDYQAVAAAVEPAMREKYAKSLVQVQALVDELFGPRKGESAKAELERSQFGTTRWDRAIAIQHRILWADNWASSGPGQQAVNVPYRRQEDFAGTEVAAIFPMIEHDLDKMLQPQWTCYWQFFTDDSKPGHFYGGIGPEIVGTLLLALLTMAFALPLGVISAAYLVECGKDNLLVRIIRTCVNTLAGVPSIVFGLFGLAFFVMNFLPMFGMAGKGSIWAGSLTLALLVLPMMIRASEEAIRAVPVAYKEAALALGASRLRTFITVTLPAALPGILTGVILSISRAAGETAPILFTAGAAVAPLVASLGDETRTLSYGSWHIAMVEPEAAKVPHNQYGMVMTLVVLVLVLNAAAIFVRSRLAKRLRGG